MKIILNLDKDREIHTTENLITSVEYLQLPNKYKQLYKSTCMEKFNRVIFKRK